MRQRNTIIWYGGTPLSDEEQRIIIIRDKGTPLYGTQNINIWRHYFMRIHTHYVTSSYILCHIIIHTMSHHTYMTTLFHENTHILCTCTQRSTLYENTHMQTDEKIVWEHTHGNRWEHTHAMRTHTWKHGRTLHENTHILCTDRQPRTQEGVSRAVWWCDIVCMMMWHRHATRTEEGVSRAVMETVPNKSLSLSLSLFLSLSLSLGPRKASAGLDRVLVSQKKHVQKCISTSSSSPV